MSTRTDYILNPLKKMGLLEMRHELSPNLDVDVIGVCRIPPITLLF
jgi:hypothetical protein